MTIIESKVTKGGSDTVPYGDGYAEIEYMDEVSGTIEVEGTPSYMRSREWDEEAFELILEEHGDIITLSDLYAYCDFSWQEDINRPGTYLITYSV